MVSITWEIKIDLFIYFFNLEVQAQTPNGSVEPTDASDTVSVLVCSNQQVDQSKQINLGLSPSLNMLKEQIQKNFEEFTDESTLEILGDDNTWTQIAVDNINIPLIDIGIKNNSTISIVNKEKAPPAAALSSDDTSTD